MCFAWTIPRSTRLRNKVVVHHGGTEDTEKNWQILYPLGNGWFGIAVCVHPKPQRLRLLRGLRVSVVRFLRVALGENILRRKTLFTQRAQAQRVMALGQPDAGFVPHQVAMIVAGKLIT